MYDNDKRDTNQTSRGNRDVFDKQKGTRPSVERQPVDDKQVLAQR